MSFDVHWDVDKYRDDHESEDHWQLKRAFIERWKHDYPEERLVCLAKVFANMEFMGCRYPPAVMQEVARLSHEVAQSYRKSKKGKLQRTFVSASDAAEDRAKGIKREGGVVVEAPPTKSSKIDFVPQGHSGENNESIEIKESDDDIVILSNKNGTHIETGENIDESTKEKMDNQKLPHIDVNEYINEMKNRCLDIARFNERMFYTNFGKLVLLIRPWESKMGNIQTSCQLCNIPFSSSYENGCFSLIINGKLTARATGDSKAESRSIVEILAWNRLREEVISVVVKQQWLAHGDARISVSDVSGKRSMEQEFGTPVENSVATKMMKLMGWKGGGLGAGAQGIAEPIKPNLQMVNRAGLGSTATDIKQLRRAAFQLMRRYLASDTFDLDLIFSSEFSKEERAELHSCAQRTGLSSKSYGDKDRFLVVKKKLNPFALVQAVAEKGGSTLKYQVFIPNALGNMNGR